MKILTVIADGFEDNEAIGTIAILRRAGLDVTVSGLNSTTARGRFQNQLVDLKNLRDLDYASYDALVIPGGPEYILEEKDAYFLSMVKYFMSENKIVAAICAAPTILGHLGLLKNRDYTCFTSMNEDFGGQFHDQYVVTDGNLITGRSVAATIDFALAIVGKIQGDEAVEKLKREIYYEER
mgnify:FL=1